jgi:Fe-S cluster biogenesis protein NfuA
MQIIMTAKQKKITKKKTTGKKTGTVEERVEKILVQVRPYIQMHSGDVFLSGYKDGVVTLLVTGACAHCSMSDITYNMMLGGILKKEIPEIKDIVIDMSK